MFEQFVEDGAGRRCMCAETFYGESCEKSCAPGFFLENCYFCDSPDLVCHEEIDACIDNNNCSNNSSCSDILLSTVNNSTGRTCVCDDAYFGETCEFVDFCVTVGCQNEAKCTNLIGGIDTSDVTGITDEDREIGRSCLCQSGFFGNSCGSSNATSNLQATVELVMTTSTAWNSSYSDPSSQAYIALAGDLSAATRATFEDNSNGFVLKDVLVSLSNSAKVSF